MKNTKRVVGLMIVLMMIPVFAFAAAQREGAAGADRMEFDPRWDAAGIPDLGGEKISIWTFLHEATLESVDNMSELAAVKWLEDKLNVDIQYIHPPQGQAQDAFSVLISSRDLPDIIMYMNTYYPGGIQGAFNDGIAWAAVDDYIDEYAPNFQEKILSDPEYSRMVRNDDGQITHFGSKVTPKEGSVYAGAAYIGPLVRKDYLQDTGLPAPVTIADWYDVLTAMKDNGVDIPYAWGSSGRDQTSFVATFSGAYGVYENFMVREDGTVTFGPMEPEFREYLTEMNRWYEEDLINQDLVVHTDVDHILPLTAAGRTGAMTTHLANYQFRYYVPVAKDDSDVDFIPVQYAVLREGGPLNRFRHTTFGLNDHKTITVQARNPLASMVFVDSLYHDEINFMMNFGAEGVYHRITEDGEVTREVELDREPDAAVEIAGQTMLVGISMWGIDGWPNETALEAMAIWRQADYDGKIPTEITFTPEEAAIVARYETDLKTYADEMITKFFVGTEPLDRYDEFVRRMESFGLNELLEVYQNAVDRYSAR